jgi:hypothetical protein
MNKTIFDFGKFYGGNRIILNNSFPFNVILAEGTAIKVFPCRKIIINWKT